MFELKPLPPDAVPAALRKAEHYRLLNEPRAAESICHDILATDPDNQSALTILVLAITDQLGRNPDVSPHDASAVLRQVRGEYAQAYYAGIICERQGKATLRQNTPGCGFDAFEWFTEAMEFYEKAETLREPGNDDPALRWNACARIITRHNLARRPHEEREPFLE